MAESAAPDELYLIDGNSLAYRAFFALPESIATSTGFPTNAIFGFASMLVKLLTEHGQKPTVVVWDKGHSGRKEVYAEYKAQRTSRPSLLKEQWPHIVDLVESFGYTNISVDGYEADDVIASLAERAREQGIPSMIVTGDRDAFQLIGEDGLVRVMATSRGITDTKTYDRQAVIDRYGIPPEKVPDFYGLKGDTSDNIPGVPGIGDKTAADLLQRFGDLETVLASVDEISGAKRKENLTNHADNARISRDLATIKRDIDVPLDVRAELTRPPDRSKLREVFRQFELRDPLRRLEEAFADDEEAAPAPIAATTLTAKVREATLADLPKLPHGAEVTVAVLAPPPPAEGELFATQEAFHWAVAEGETVLVGTADRPEDVVAALAERPIVAHDAKAQLFRIPPLLVHDTLLGAYLLEPARRGYPFRELTEERGFGVEGIEDEAAADAILTQALAAWQREQIEERGLESVMNEIELPLVGVLREMEQAGVRLDKDQFRVIKTKVDEEILSLERQVWEQAGEEFVLGSPKQLAAILFDKLGLSRKRAGKTGSSTDARVLQAIRDEHPIIPLLERWRELNQLSKTYLDVLPDLTDGESRIHTTFLQAAAQTGRLASTNPNMQNVPVRTELGREIRRCFEAAPGMVLLSADYSQVELRILAHVADEPVLKEIFVRGEDVHTATASQVFGKPAEELTPMDRSKAKMINYGIVYGLSAFGLSDRLNIPREEAKEFIDTYLERFPQVHAFMTGTIEEAKEAGYVTTLYGRRRQIPEIRARNWGVRSLGERLAVNTVIQGTAADVMKLAMTNCHRALAAGELTTRMVLTIHDELLFEGPEEEMDAVRALAEREMTSPWTHTPALAVDVGVGRTWMDAK